MKSFSGQGDPSRAFGRFWAPITSAMIFVVTLAVTWPIPHWPHPNWALT
ncbi:hypothetical protein [Actinopolyspora alba]|nr:hypothetical protein [Actinopolyspora alba]